jgi:hypothetical protein
MTEQEISNVIVKRLSEYDSIKEELRQLQEGERVVLPVNRDHAKYMLIVAMNYLGIDPTKPVDFNKE